MSTRVPKQLVKLPFQEYKSAQLQAISSAVSQHRRLFPSASPLISRSTNNINTHRSPETTTEYSQRSLRSNSMSSSTDKKVLVMGIKVGPADLSREQTLELFKDQIDAAGKAGVDMHVHQVDVSMSRDIILREARDVLKKEQWNGVAIGFGLRGREDLTPLFEHLVNAVTENVQPVPRFAFPLRPHLVWEAVARVYGIDQ